MVEERAEKKAEKKADGERDKEEERKERQRGRDERDIEKGRRERVVDIDAPWSLLIEGFLTLLLAPPPPPAPAASAAAATGVEGPIDPDLFFFLDLAADPVEDEVEALEETFSPETSLWLTLLLLWGFGEDMTDASEGL